MAAPANVRRARPPRAAAGLAVVLVAFCVACAGPGGRSKPIRGGALRISQVAEAGDAIRRASTRLVLEGLGAKSAARALDQYERAIKIDATNPYAYLALASYEVQWGDANRGMQSLDQAELLLESEQLRSPRVEPHLIGLRGRSRVRTGRHSTAAQAGTRTSDAPDLLERARRMAPDVWGDGWLTPAELR